MSRSRLFPAFRLQGDADMNMKTSLPNTILSFAFTGVMGPHSRRPVDYAPPRVVSAAVQPKRV